jgi:RNA polymerase sigma-70 factor, ECF subfamily
VFSAPIACGLVDDALAAVYQTDRAGLLARLIRIVGDVELAEDALQDATVAAAGAWRDGGIPDNPAAWLLTTSRRKAIDRLRRSAASERRERAWGELAIAWDVASAQEPITDDRLRLIFTCCHPALGMDAQVALTLRLLGGLSTEEVAVAFLIPQATLAQRLVRAKRRIRQARIRYRVPTASELPDRLAAVLAVVYLIFNAGYLAPGGPMLVRTDLCDEGRRLGELLVGLLPDEPEPLGLLALMCFQDSRRSARTDAQGRALTLDEQDRDRWDTAAISRGLGFLERARQCERPGPYQLKAAIGALHAGVRSPSETDWTRIVALYDRLLEWEPTEVVRLNRAVAVAMSDGPAVGLELLDEPGLVAALDRYHPYHLVRADLLRRLGHVDAASEAYRRARAHTANPVEHAFVDRRLNELGAVDGFVV